MRHKIFIAFLSLLTATSTLDMAKAGPLPYKNKNLPIEERVEDLLNRMTVDEKIAQIRHIHSSKIFNRQELDMKKLTDWAGNTSWGFVEGFPLTGDNCAKSMYLDPKIHGRKNPVGNTHLHGCRISARCCARRSHQNISPKHRFGEHL